MTSYISTIERIQRELANLRIDDAREASKEATAQTKINRAQQAMSAAKSASVLKSKMSDLERAIKEGATASKKRADLSKKIADKSKQLNGYQARQSKSDEQASKKMAAEQKRLVSERKNHETFLKQSFAAIKETKAQSVATSPEKYDFFISHASEDKEAFVRDLATELRALGATIFYDEYTLRVGDSLRRKIDHGLANSSFGIVVLSEHFFSKEWPTRELDGMVALEIDGQTRILPIWHKVSKDEVARFSPTLADKVALNTSLKSIKDIAKELHSLVT